MDQTDSDQVIFDRLGTLYNFLSIEYAIIVMFDLNKYLRVLTFRILFNRPYLIRANEPRYENRLDLG